MNSQNTMKRSEYIRGNVNGCLLLLPGYLLLLFSPIPDTGRVASFWILVSTGAIVLLLSLLLTHNHYRSRINLGCNLILVYGVYFLLSNWQLNRMLLQIVGHAVSITVCCSTLLTFLRFFIDHPGSCRPASLKRLFSRCLLRSRTMAALALLFLFLLAAASPLLPIAAWHSTNTVFSALTSKGKIPSQTMAENEDTVLLLREDMWSQLTPEERLAVMNTVADIEASHLGIPRLTVHSTPLGDSTIGSYNNVSRTITLNSKYLATADAHTMLFATCHECYHAYQYHLVALYNKLTSGDQKLLLFRHAAQYREEFSDYIRPEDDYAAYDSQLCETQSDHYAGTSVAAYDRYIEQHSSASHIPS